VDILYRLICFNLLGLGNSTGLGGSV